MNLINETERYCDEFNRACDAYNDAMHAMISDVDLYEKQLRETTRLWNQLPEHAIRYYLESRCDNPQARIEYHQHQQDRSDFYGLIDIMLGRAAPPLGREDAEVLRRSQRIRNLFAHQGAVPQPSELKQALLITRRILTRYLGVQDSELYTLKGVSNVSPAANDLRKDYLDYLLRGVRGIDITGISRSAENFTVQSIDAFFVPWRARPEPPLTQHSNFGGQTATHKYKAASKQLPVEPMKEVIRNPRLVLMGEAGAGKSTALAQIVYSLATSTSELLPELQGLLPIRVDAPKCSRWLETGNITSIYDYIVKDCHDYKELLIKRIKAGGCIVLIDGFDEVAESQKHLLRDEINNFVNLYPTNRFIVTSKPYAYGRHRLNGFEH